MALIRFLGSIVSTALTIVLVTLLTTSLLLVNVVGFFSENNIRAVTEEMLSDEKTQESVAETIAGAVDFLPVETVKEILNLPSVKEVLPDVIADMASDTLSGINQILTETPEDLSGALLDRLGKKLEEKPDTLKTVAGDIASVLLGSSAVQNAIASALSDSDLSLPTETVTALLDVPALSRVVGEIMAESLIGALKADGTPVDVTGKLTAAIEADPEPFDDAILNALTESGKTPEDFEASIRKLAEESGKTPPASGLSLAELAAFAIGLRADDLNHLFGDMISGESPALDEVAASDPSAKDELPLQKADLIDFAFRVLRSSLAVWLVAGTALIFYLLMALLTLSFRLPLLFMGLASALSGGILVIVSRLPIEAILRMAKGFEGADVLFSVINVCWTSLSAKLMTSGLLCFAAALVLVVLFSLFKKRKKQNA